MKQREQIPFDFDGSTYSAEHDRGRLGAQLARVSDLMRDGRWRTLEEIRDSTGDASIASISARLRDLRKPRFGAWTVERRARGDRVRGLFEYRMLKEGVKA